MRILKLKLLICGGRDFTDIEYAIPLFQAVHNTSPVSQLICGMARGGDTLGKLWANEVDIPVAEFHPDWDTHGRRAGRLRNQRMLDEGQPNLVLALPGGTGTAHMVDISKSAGIPVLEYTRLFFSRARDPDWGFLSNFLLCEQTDHNGIRYKSNEHWYQAEKTLDPNTRQWIVDAPDPALAKKYGNHKNVVLRSDWDTHKIVAMREGLRMKFADPVMADRLRQTGDLYLVEYAPWGDRFWGVDKNYEGQNWLGRLLMERRRELQGVA